MTAANAASLSSKLVQMANGAVYSDYHQVVSIHDQKLDVLEDIIEAANGEPVLVAYWFKHDLQRIEERLAKLKAKGIVLKTEDDIREWNKGNITVGLLHPASAGHGLNLQRADIIWFGSVSLGLWSCTNKPMLVYGDKGNNLRQWSSNTL